jgi:S1-C subfamily serine protease
MDSDRNEFSERDEPVVEEGDTGQVWVTPHGGTPERGVSPEEPSTPPAGQPAAPPTEPVWPAHPPGAPSPGGAPSPWVASGAGWPGRHTPSTPSPWSSAGTSQAGPGGGFGAGGGQGGYPPPGGTDPWGGYYGGWGGPPPGAGAPKRRRGLGAFVIAAVLVLVAGALGGGLAVALNRTTPTGSSSNSASAVSASKVNVSAITAQVDPAVVDITSTLGYQDGQAAGTGMVVTSSGEVLTNNHVIEGATSIAAKVAGTSKSYPAKVLGVDPSDDVALIQLQGASGLPTVQLGNSSTVAVGDPVVAIGNALDLPGSPTVTEGTVSALNRSIQAGDSSSSNTEQLSGLIQTDAPLAPGNSGGPLVNSHAQVIGMNTAAATGAENQSTSSNVGFAIPINKAAAIMQTIQSGSTSNPKIRYGAPAFLGVQVESVSSAGNGIFGNGGIGGFFGGQFGGGQGPTSATSGAEIVAVESNTPAASIGLEQGDVITSFDGKTINSPNDLTQVISTLKPGDRVQIGWVDTAGQQHSTTVQLGSGPAA